MPLVLAFAAMPYVAHPSPSSWQRKSRISGLVLLRVQALALAYAGCPGISGWFCHSPAKLMEGVSSAYNRGSCQRQNKVACVWVELAKQICSLEVMFIKCALLEGTNSSYKVAKHFQFETPCDNNQERLRSDAGGLSGRVCHVSCR